MWLDYAIGFGGVALFMIVVVTVHTVMLNRDIAERRKEQERQAGHAARGG